MKLREAGEIQAAILQHSDIGDAVEIEAVNLAMREVLEHKVDVMRTVPILKSCFCCKYNVANGCDIIRCEKHSIVECDYSFTKVCDEWKSDGDGELVWYEGFKFEERQ